MTKSYKALATDYDGTLAVEGRVLPSTVAALERLRADGCRLVMVTGRELGELQQNFPELELFDRVVAENGALLYRPADKSETMLSEPPPAAFVEALRARGVAPISTGRVIVATWEPHQTAALEVIHEQGLELHVIFNKGAVMILPSSVNKASGLAVALKELGLSAHDAVGVGDAENDHAFLAMCECAAAVGNSLPTLLERADIRLRGERGAGVEELIEAMITRTLTVPARHEICLGTRLDGREVRVKHHGANLLINGPSLGRRGHLTRTLLERLGESKYQYLMVDVEGSYATHHGAIVLGDHGHAPTMTAIFDALQRPSQSVVASLLAVATDARPAFFCDLLSQVEKMRAHTGRPHWLIVDSIDRLFAATTPVPFGLVGIAAHPERLPAGLLASAKILRELPATADGLVRIDDVKYADASLKPN